ncbi:MAG: AAA family ATPase [Pseudomonadota bacterium]
MTLRLNLFGSFAVEEGKGEIIRLPTRKSEALLCYLIENGGEVSREAIADLLWPLSGPDQARASLRQELSVLRKGLGDEHGDRVHSGSDRLAFDATGVETDLNRLRVIVKQPDVLPEHTLEALALHKGPFLGNVRIRSQPFTDWVWTTRQMLEGQALSLGMDTLSAVRDAGNTTLRRKIAQGLLRIDTCYEPAYRELMQSYLEDGEPDLARRQFEVCQEALKSKLDVEPAEQTILLSEQIEAVRATHSDFGSALPRSVGNGLSGHQRRTITVLSLLAPISRTDPEEFAQVSEKVASLITQIIEANGGSVFEAARGRILASFGYPQSHGRDGDMALTAAFEVLDALTAGRGPVETCQIGLSEGVVLVSEELRHGTNSQVVNGLPIREAEQISQWAEAGTVFISSGMGNSISPQFQTSEVAEMPSVKVVHHPRKLHSIDQNERLTTSVHPLVGRETILAKLQLLVAQAKNGSGVAANISGRPGDGKSRLLQEIADHALENGFEVLIYRGSVQAQQSALEPLIDNLMRMTATDADENVSTRELLSQAVASLGAEPKGLPVYLAQLHHAASVITDTEIDQQKEIRESALNILSRQAQLASCDRPRLFLFEDTQWFDASTCEAIGRLIDILDECFSCVLMTSRSGELPVSLKHPLADTIELGPLDPQCAARLLQGLIGKQEVPEPTQLAALEKSEGNPLMIEEFAKSLAQASRPSEEDAGLVGTLFSTLEGRDPAALPNRLLPLLLTRIDSVPGAIQLLQQASILGRRFRFKELVQLLSPTRVQKQLVDALEAAEILFPVRRGDNATYMFKHALINEAIYATIPASYRVKLHAAAANVLLSEPDGVNHAEVARHFRAAENHDAAARHFEQSGDKSMRGAAHAEAISEYCEALDMVRYLPLSKYRMQRELTLNRKAAAQYIALRGIPTSDAAPFYEAASALSEELNDIEEAVNAAWGLWSIHLMVAELDPCLAIAQTLHESLPDGTSGPARLIVSYMLGITHAYRGTSSNAVAFLETVENLHTEDMTGELQSRFGMDIAMTSDSFLAWVYALRGEAELADKTSKRALARARSNNTKLNHVFAHVFAATKALFSDDIDEAEYHARIGWDGAKEMGYKQWVAQARFQLARIADIRGEKDALNEMEIAMDAYRASNMVLAMPYAFVWIAEAHLRRANPEGALRTLDALAAHTDRTQQKYFNQRGDAVREMALAALSD